MAILEVLVREWHELRWPLVALTLVWLICNRLWAYYWPKAQSIKDFSHFEERQERKVEVLSVSTKDVKTESILTPRDEEAAFTAVNPLKRKIRSEPKRIIGRRAGSPKQKEAQQAIERVQPVVFFSSLSGSTEKAAINMVTTLSTSLQTATSNILPPKLLDLSDMDYDDYFTSLPKSNPSDPVTRYFYFILVPTYNIDTYLDNFLEHLRETHHDFRIDTAPLQNILGYAVFGFGDKKSWPTEETGFCVQATEVDRWMARLTAKKRAYPVGMGDVSGDAELKLEQWRQGVEEVVLDLASGKTFGEGAPGSGDAVESDEEDEEYDTQDKTDKPTMTDVENLGSLIDAPAKPSSRGPVPVDFTNSKKSAIAALEAKEMVPKSSPTYASLTKQGYTIVGSHSGVKLCRWTKSALRGRGSCYKYSFYGIQSHLCMETTPSLSCSNKCVFCWRHGTNPVGTTWRWTVDPPDLIFDGAKKGHYQKIKMMRGVPGVRAERFEEAMRIRHCALSLVGEPIFYPHIGEFVAMLHAERISTFLVCNAQHPDQLAALGKVTQLYVSIDASNKESLRRIDRPLHRDFWQRFQRCLDIIKQKRDIQRTVFRLTLVKGFNIDDEAEGYADLVEQGLPCFIEVKGVTYCGTTTAAGAGLTMQNVPFYEEVCAFVEALDRALARRGLDYGIAAEHAHSCCILLASKRFFRPGRDGQQKWHTQIDYTRFFELLESGAEFGPEDYCEETPKWAVWGKGGFDPRDERAPKKGKAARQGENLGIGEVESRRRALEMARDRVVVEQVESATGREVLQKGDARDQEIVQHRAGAAAW